MRSVPASPKRARSSCNPLLLGTLQAPNGWTGGGDGWKRLMPNAPWKSAERRAAGLIGGKRYPANLGQAVDVESSWACAQVKEVARLSLAELTALAMQAEREGARRSKSGVVFVRYRHGRGRHAAPMLVVMTETVWRDWHG